MDTQKNTTNSVQSFRSIALFTGISLLLMAIIAPIGDGLLNREVPSEWHIRMGLFIFFWVLVLDIVVSWGLFIVFKPVDRNISLLSALFRLIYSALLGALLFKLVEAIQIFNQDEFVNNAESFLSNISEKLLAFNNGWIMAMAVFGIHLGLLAYLVYKSKYVPKWIGILLFIAFIGYTSDGLGIILSDQYNLNLILYTFIGEVILLFWLIIKGSRIKEDELFK